MSKLEYLKKVKAFLRKVVKYRDFLQKRGLGKLSSQFSKTETANINHALPKLVSCDKVQQYLIRKEAVIRMLIPTNKHAWFDELHQLLTTNPGNHAQ